MNDRSPPRPAPVGLPVTVADVEAAARAIGDVLAPSPAAPSATLSAITGAEVWLKFENLRFTGSFKERGARNFLLHLSPEARARGVVAASAGNHAQGVAYNAQLLGIPATIVMPEATPFTKVANTAHHGAEVIVEGGDYAASYAVAQRIVAERDATLVPAFDHPLIIAGQGTVGLEVLDQMPALDAILVPTGGGGLLAGIAVAVKARHPAPAVIGVQVAGYTGMAHALGRGPAPTGGTTIAEGIAVTEPGHVTRQIASALVDDVVTVSDEQIEEAIDLGAEVEKTVLEGAGAAGLAALLAPGHRFTGRRVGVILSGGNIDTRVLASVLLRALARSGRLVRLRIEVPDRPGVLATVARIVADTHSNVVDVVHHRDVAGVALTRLVLELAVETRDRAHAEAIVGTLTTAGFAATLVEQPGTTEAVTPPAGGRAG